MAATNGLVHREQDVAVWGGGEGGGAGGVTKEDLRGTTYPQQV